MASGNNLTPPQGVHLVGSIRLPNEADDPLTPPNSARKVFETMNEALSGRLHRIPDGETGERHYFTGWQDRVFLLSPWIMHEAELAARNVETAPDDGTLEIRLGASEYDKFAIQSYADFKDLKAKGVIPAKTRFQVCIPTPVNVLTKFVRAQYQTQVEPLYEEALMQALKSIQEQIPLEELAIQWDCCLEFVMLEKIGGPGGRFLPWFDLSPNALVSRISRLASVVRSEVEMGFHLCYGDLNHKHIVQPKDTTRLVQMANLISESIQHPVNWVHMPVPIDRTDDDYFEPLRALATHHSTEIYLGLVHPYDLEGTQQRISAAKKVIKQFGVATECGWGRTQSSDIGSILEILRAVSQPLDN